MTKINDFATVLFTAPRRFIFDAAVARDKSAHFCRYSCASNIK
ncbi:MAG: hypothetical protein ACYCWE_09145 [Eubacteriales bacterium]